MIHNIPVLDRQSLSKGFSIIPADHESGGYVIIVDKPYGWTSADVVRKVKFAIQRKLKVKNLKVGHAGTLDPLATGILIVCVGKATKIAEALQAEEKEYIAEIELGATTPSFDKEKEIDRRYPTDHITEQAVAAEVKAMIGEQQQVPPIFSAKLVNGVRSYEMARQGETHELKASPITIYDAELIAYYPPYAEDAGVCPHDDKFIPGTDADAMPGIIRTLESHVPAGMHTAAPQAADMSLPHAQIRVRCSKGTYIRAIARDLGLSLESGGHLSNLRRTASGGFTIANALTMEELEGLFKNSVLN